MHIIQKLRRRRTYLLRAQAVRAEYNKYKKTELTDVKIFDKFIQPQFFISRRSFNEYIRINATKLLEALDIEIEYELNKSTAE